MWMIFFNVISIQIMHYVFGHKNEINSSILTMCTKTKKWLIKYFKVSGITTMKKQVDINDSSIHKKYEEINNKMKWPWNGKTTCQENNWFVSKYNFQFI
jgi:hypothetical protein